jgi:hypothetical protein
VRLAPVIYLLLFFARYQDTKPVISAHLPIRPKEIVIDQLRIMPEGMSASAAPRLD